MTTASITYWAPILNENYSNPQVLNMFPFSGADSRSVVFYALVYTSLFLIGICGNISTITLIRHVHSAIPYDNTMLYVLFLCGVDLISVIPLPMAISDQLLGFWIFGSVVCKIYRTLEHVGRALSTFVLAAMAYDRFLKVCYPHHKTRLPLKSHIAIFQYGFRAFLSYEYQKQYCHVQSSLFIININFISNSHFQVNWI
ncbi:hypothetical protein AB6A40_009450 [Gnathostoma spinigerum]|uniref:G-protein coupled receptors family 1 profile domain-containing protein n=1 Tax=Gnathostoma spinigerum TaxID=75299 RepID=A0ABD6ETU3_9BILA